MMGVSLARAGKKKRAARVFADFLAAYPKSARAGEVSVMLGWMRYEAGQYDDAEHLFRAGFKDKSPRVRKSAQKGLDFLSGK